MDIPLAAIDILMATCNGEVYLEEQLDSLFCQTFQDWHLLVRDDCSEDKTVAILNDYKRRYPDRITLVHDRPKRLGASLNFGALLPSSSADYIMFADQDDRWLPHKVETTLKKMANMEERYSKEKPLLVFTDLTVADEQLHVLCGSFWQHRNINPKNTSVNSLLSENVAPGCSMMLNKVLKKIAVPVPEQAILHDWWIMLLAAICGEIDFVPAPTMLYRQHGSNDVGARKRDLDEAIRYICHPRLLVDKIRSYRYFRQETVQQAAALLRKYQELMNRPGCSSNPDLITLLKNYARLDTMTFLARKAFLLRNELLRGYYLTRAAKLLFF